MESNKGARESNEDAHFSGVVKNQFAYSCVCDGHGGPQIAKFMNTTLEGYMTKNLKQPYKSHHYTFDFVVKALKDAYNKSLEDFDANQHAFKNGEGTTLSCIVYDAYTSTVTLLQVGDSNILACNAHTGEILEGPVLHHENGMGPAKTTEMRPCIANLHNWDAYERNRYQADLSCMKISVGKSTNTLDMEKRTSAVIQSPFFQIFKVPEPARAIGLYMNEMIDEKLTESDESVKQAVKNAKKVADEFPGLHRTPEITVFDLSQYAREMPIALIVACDGVFSKCAIPSNEKLAHLLVNFQGYLKDSVKGTGLEHMIHTFKCLQNDALPPPSAGEAERLSTLSDVMCKHAPDDT